MTKSDPHGTAEALRELLGPADRGAGRAWGTMLQGAGLGADDYRADRLRDHPRDVTGDPDLLNLTRPDVVLRDPPPVPGRGRGHHHHQHVHRHQHRPGRLRAAVAVREMNLAGARLARQAADEAGGRFVAGSVGPLNVTLSLSPRVDDPAYRAVGFDEVYAAYAEQIGGAGRGRRRPAADRDDLRHAERQGGDRGRPRRGAAAAAVDLGHDRGPQRADAVRADGRGVLARRSSTPSR